MSNIREIYQPVYDATAKYQTLERDVDSIKKCLDFLNNYLDKNSKNATAQASNAQVLLLEAKKNKKNARRSIISKNIAYFCGVGITYPILLNLGVLFPTWGIFFHVFLHLFLLFGINKKPLSELFRSIRDYKNAIRCQKHLGEYEDLEVRELISQCYEKIRELSGEMKDIKEYLNIVGQNLEEENTLLANEILESHGINAEIDVSFANKKLAKLWCMKPLETIKMIIEPEITKFKKE